MKSFQKTKVFLFALAIVFNYVASATPISGKVADAGTGEAIIGATIYTGSVTKVKADVFET